MAGLALIQFVAPLPLRVVHQHPPLGPLHIDDAAHHEDRDGPHHQQQHAADLAFVRLLQGTADGTGESRHNAGEDEHGDAVAHPLLGNLLPQPHEEHGAGHQGDDGGEVEGRARVVGHGLQQTHRHPGRLQQCEDQGAVSGVLGDLAAA